MIARATVSDYITPTESVSFVDRTTGNPLGSATLSGGTATLALSFLTPGTHTIVATYLGNASLLGSSATASPLTIVNSVVVTDPNARGSLVLVGGPTLSVPGNLVVDSSSSSAVIALGGPSVTASAIDVHGGIASFGGPTFTPAPSTGVATGGDPLASPSSAGLKDLGSVNLDGAQKATIGPGIYTRIDVGGGASLTMEPGTYTIEGGGFGVRGGGSVTGSGVFIENAASHYAEYLRSRLGGGSARVPTVRRAIIPLGVDVDHFRPPTPDERARARRTLGIGEDEPVLLFVGRLAHHAKAHPFPIFRGSAEAAARSGKTVRLLLVGWAPHPAVHQAFVEGTRELAPGVVTSLLDDRNPSVRQAAWHAADLFVSPSDSIQETFGLAVVEAMATGLPVVASDWDGYRDLVEDGSTGFLVPTSMLAGATVGATSRLLVGELSYDHFLAECGQATVVDVPLFAGAVARLVENPDLRRRMGEAGRSRAVERFAWPRVIAAYEDLWRDLDASRRARALADRPDPRWRDTGGPSGYPSPERTFAGYPTQTLSAADRVEPALNAIDRVDRLLAMPLIHHAPGRRADAALIRQAIAIAPTSVADLDTLFAAAGIEPGIARATVAWMLKYDLLRAPSSEPDAR